MKIVSATFVGLLAVLGTITVVSSCSKTDRLVGTWEGIPERIHNMPNAAEAVSTVSLDFGQRESNSQRGPVFLSSVIEINQAVVGGGLYAPIQANITATASIEGYYMPEDRSDDDYILSLDPTKLKINIDPAGVVFTQNVMTEAERPELDSLTAATIEHWRVLVTAAAREQFYNYRSIEDVEIHHGEMMSCEVADKDLTFRRISRN